MATGRAGPRRSGGMRVLGLLEPILHRRGARDRYGVGLAARTRDDHSASRGVRRHSHPSMIIILSRH
jgi:hypothetical protein